MLFYDMMVILFWILLSYVLILSRRLENRKWIFFFIRKKIFEYKKFNL